MKPVETIEINLDSVKDGLRLFIDSRTSGTLYDAEESAEENNEGRYQLIEGYYYDYEFNDPNFLFGSIGQQIVIPHKRNKHLGTLSPNIFVGTLSLPVRANDKEEELINIKLEVQSIKSDYRTDYRDMLELITEKCTDLLLQANSPISHSFEPKYNQDSLTLYQRFAFIKSVIGTEEFAEAIHRIVSAPVTKWTSVFKNTDIRQTRRFSNSNVRELLKSGNRTSLPESHYLRNYGIETLPEKITTTQKTDSVDTPENRFIKHALETFLKFCSDINNAASKGSKLDNESGTLIRELESQLNHAIFKTISRPTTLIINSPVLQRKEGYREVLRVWLMFDLAAKLIWTGGDDIYRGGKKDIATLYEYWLFFKLLDLFQNIFDIKSKDVSDLIKETPDGLNLQIKQGKHTALEGVYDVGLRKLNIRFNYNRSFGGKTEYDKSGSWTTTLRPDYTLSFWPVGITEEKAEYEVLIVHIHFDAKYKVANLSDFLKQNSEEDLDNEKTENRKGIYKNADLLKMHAYKDAIRRTGGAYVLYPGDNLINHKGFHEIIPGLGAFPVQPSKLDSGIVELKAFILEIIDHFINRASQREKLAFRTFDIFKNPPDQNNILMESLPEVLNSNRGLIPDNTFVLVGYSNSPEKLEWFNYKKKYAFRMGEEKGSLELNNEVVNARYLLLRTKGKENASHLFNITSVGPKVYSAYDLIAIGYPVSKNPKDFYLVIDIEEVVDEEFKEVTWNFKELKKYQSIIASEKNPYAKVGIPFTVTLTELMLVKKK